MSRQLGTQAVAPQTIELVRQAYLLAQFDTSQVAVKGAAAGLRAVKLSAIVGAGAELVQQAQQPQGLIGIGTGRLGAAGGPTLGSSGRRGHAQALVQLTQ
jgi:hypothetical protein